MSKELSFRLARIETTLTAQRAFLHRVPDPDTRERAEEHLIILVQMRDELRTRAALRESNYAAAA